MGTPSGHKAGYTIGEESILRNFPRFTKLGLNMEKMLLGWRQQMIVLLAAELLIGFTTSERKTKTMSSELRIYSKAKQ